MFDYLQFLAPLAAFIALAASEWETFWPVSPLPWYKRPPSKRGAVILIAGFSALLLAVVEYRNQTSESRELLLRIAREGERIGPGDFYFKLQTSAHLNAFDEPGQALTYQAPENLSFSYSIEDAEGRQGASVLGQFTLLPAAVTPYPSGRGSLNKFWHYIGTNLAVMLSDLKYLEDLNGMKIQMQVPRRTMRGPFANIRLTWINVDVYIRGRHFSGTADEGGKVVIDIPSLASNVN